MLTDRELYRNNCKANLNLVPFNHDLILCDDSACNNPAHISAIDRLYNDIVSSLNDASATFCTQSRTVRQNLQVAGWNEVCSDLHSEARDAFLMWRQNGSPRHGQLYELMRVTRARFKLALRQCRQNNSIHEANSLARKLLSANQNDFWKQIKLINNYGLHSPHADCVNGCTGESEIAEMWKDQYMALLNSSTLRFPINYNEIEHAPLQRFTTTEIKSAVSLLKIGKSAGPDLLESENFKYCDDSICVYLCILFNCMIIHNYLPKPFMDTVIVPLVKDKKESVSDCNNYRPIAITTIMSKIFELVILDQYGDVLVTTANQFGFKKQHGTENCIFVFKQVIDY